MMVDTTVPVIVLSRKRYTKVGQGDFWLKHRWSAMVADVITKNNNGRYKEEKKRNRRVSDPRVSTINGNQINGHVLVYLLIWLTWYVYMYRNKAVATRPFDVGPSNFHTMTSLGPDVFLWKKKLKNFSNFKMAAIFWSKMTKNEENSISCLLFYVESWCKVLFICFLCPRSQWKE